MEEPSARYRPRVGFLENLCSVICLLFNTIFRAFRRRSHSRTTASEEGPRVIPPSEGISIATPNHFPFHGLDMACFNSPHVMTSSEKTWRGILQRSQMPAHRPSEVELRDIHPTSDTVPPTKGKGAVSTSTRAIGAASTSTVDKPRELWRKDEAMMAQGRYAFDPQFAAKYKMKQLLGEGSFGFVWVAERQRDGLEVAVKFILREKVPPANWIFDGELGLVPMEVHIMKMAIHKNIVGFIDYFSDFRFAYLVSELHGTSWTWPNPRLNHERNIGLRPPAKLVQLSNHTLHDDLRGQGLGRRPPCDLFECIEAHNQLPLSIVRHIFQQVLEAVNYLYSMGIVHRDIKDENIVVDENYHVKLIDFGSANFFPTRYGSTTMTSSSSGASARISMSTPTGGGDLPLTAKEAYFDKFNGTIAFAAPEIIRGLRYRPSEAEVWSLGVLLYTMVFRKSPFNSSEAILNSPLVLPSAEDNSGLYDLLRKMLQKNPLKRIRLDEIVTHPFLNNNKG